MKRIKKSLIFLFFIILLIPFTVQVVYAEEEDCSDVMSAVNDLDKYESLLQQLDCDNAVDKTVITQCNTIKLEKSNTVEKLLDYNDRNICSSIDLSSVVHDYENNCSNRYSSKLKVVTDTIMNFFYISAPFILLLFGSLDFFKIVTGSNPNEIKKHRSNFIKRLVAFILLYFTPFVVNAIFSITPYNINGSNYICVTEITLEPSYSSPDISGIYGGNNYGSGSGQAIADAAKEIKEYTSANNFYYGFPTWYGITAATVDTSKNTSKTICCATLVGGALYKAGIYDLSELNYGIDSSPSTAKFLRDKGWTLIKDQSKLEAGDVMFFYTNGATEVLINGEWTKPGHVEIYAGNGRRYNTGNTNSIRVVDEPNGYRSNFIYAYRYPGN